MQEKQEKLKERESFRNKSEGSTVREYLISHVMLDLQLLGSIYRCLGLVISCSKLRLQWLVGHKPIKVLIRARLIILNISFKSKINHKHISYMHISLACTTFMHVHGVDGRIEVRQVRMWCLAKNPKAQLARDGINASRLILTYSIQDQKIYQ